MCQKHNSMIAFISKYLSKQYFFLSVGGIEVKLKVLSNNEKILSKDRSWTSVSERKGLLLVSLINCFHCFIILKIKYSKLSQELPVTRYM